MSHTKERNPLSAGAAPGDFQLPDMRGGEVSLREITANGPALLAFYKVSCPVCQLTLPYLDRIHAGGRLPVYAISQNSSSDSAAFNKRFGLSLPTLLDNEDRGFAVSNTFGISSVPTLFLIERDGTIAEVIEGWRKSAVERFAGRAGVNPFREGDAVPDFKAG